MLVTDIMIQFPTDKEQKGLKLTANGDFSWSLHRNAVAIIRIARNMIHIPCNIVDHSDHVPGVLLPH